MEDGQTFKPSKPPMSDSEFHNFLDGVGNLIRPQEFRLSVYQGGVEHSLRKVVWRHLLNLYPDGMTGKQRFEYMKKKKDEYVKLRDAWKEQFSQGRGTEELKFVTNLVKKDVLRTDRKHKFFAGGDDNKNVLALFNILVTYAITHPQVSYCQGMSDIASPLLVIENDEASAYICLCGAMNRLSINFSLDGDAMTTKFKHLALLLHHHDPDFYFYLKRQNADDMFFCYRWVLLELKREFPFIDALYMLEVMWSSLPPDPPEVEISLTDDTFTFESLTQSPSSPALPSTAYMRLKHLCRPTTTTKANDSPDEAKEPITEGSSQSPDVSITVNTCQNEAVTPIEEEKVLDPKEFIDMTASLTRDMIDRSTSIDRSLENGVSKSMDDMNIHDSPEHMKTNGSKVTVPDDLAAGDTESDGKNVTEINENEPNERTKESTDSIPKRPVDILLNQHRDSKEAENKSLEEEKALIVTENGVTERSVNVESVEEATEASPSIDFVKVYGKPGKLPPPSEFGCGNPFLMFLCLTLLLQQRDHIMRHRMDYNDLAMHFDRMVRQHDVHKVLHQAKHMFGEYLRASQPSSESSESDDVSV